jgi:NAD(P)-dependent dehydrogenase (short-subunit alcohol dehydrogenase family)
MQELQGKAAIVTGASRGIGAATAEELARQGVAVVLAARSRGEIDAVAKKIEAAGGRASAVACDVARYADVAVAVEHCRSTYGSLDILVNNAGVIDPIARLADSDPEGWDAVVDINLKGVYHGLRAAIPVMEAQGGGVIVNISSGAATSPLEGWSHYCATKAAVLMLTRCVDKEYRDKGIRVVGLSPGTVATDMQRAIKASGINAVSQMDFSAHIPPEWPARAVAWLCTDAAREFDGGDFSLKTEDGRRRVGLVA